MKIFRKTRFDLLEKSRFGKYLLYATGEIVLVVIGILIAISIDNWREERAMKEKTIFELKMLSTELDSDIAEYTTRIEVCPMIINYLQKLSTNDYEDLDLNNFQKFVSANDNTMLFGDSYTILKNNGGLDLIKDADLRKKMAFYNDVRREITLQEIQYGKNAALAYIDPTVLSFLDFDSENKLVTKKILKVIKEKKLNNIINLQLATWKKYLFLYQGDKTYALNLKKQINRYIEKQE
ncbi:DUF6090 family protein [Halpernia sp.]|uniref:DUF6090 family protein n=1 Tax=Halpernia sp. TaxID=2782209 RepID=UPI003A9381AA